MLMPTCSGGNWPPSSANSRRFCAVASVESHQQRRDQLATTVDADVHDVLGIELEIEPGAAIGNNPGCKQELAGRVRLTFVMIEEHAGRPVHLRDDHVRAVHDEGAHVRHRGMSPI